MTKGYFDTIFIDILTEGGAGGHMPAIFDLPTVTTGKDIISTFHKIADHLSANSANVKIDGINISVRLTTINGKKQFVIDRGSAKELDVKGVTKDDLTSRFGAGHGMIEKGGKVLDIFNDGLSSISPELQHLGMLDNSNLIFNIEYVEGKTNVVKYDNNFICIHGLLEVYTDDNNKRKIKSVNLDIATLNKLVEKLNPVANKYKFEVVQSFKTKSVNPPDYDKVLNTNYTINYGKNKVTKSLNAWLAILTIPKTESIILQSKKKVNALSKEILVNLKSGIALNTYIETPTDYTLAINGYFTYLAVMELGHALLQSLSSTLGNVSEQEGIVINDKNIYSGEFKVTGRFIISGMQSTFAKKVNESTSAKSKTVIFTFGRFNPPTAGHEILIKKMEEAAAKANCDYMIFVSKTQDDTKNPLSSKLRIRLLGTISNRIAQSAQKDIIECVKYLDKLKYTDIIGVFGTDRAYEVKTLLQKYNHRDYDFNSIDVFEVPRSSVGISASAVRNMVKNNNKAEFDKTILSTLVQKQKDNLYKSLQKILITK